MLLARRIGLASPMYFFVIHSCTSELKAPRPASTTCTRGSFIVRYAGATVYAPVCSASRHNLFHRRLVSWPRSAFLLYPAVTWLANWAASLHFFRSILVRA